MCIIDTKSKFIQSQGLVQLQKDLQSHLHVELPRLICLRPHSFLNHLDLSSRKPNQTRSPSLSMDCPIFHWKTENHRQSLSKYPWLVVWTLLKNISQLGWLSPINIYIYSIKNVQNHQPDPFDNWGPVTCWIRWFSSAVSFWSLAGHGAMGRFDIFFGTCACPKHVGYCRPWENVIYNLI